MIFLCLVTPMKKGFKTIKYSIYVLINFFIYFINSQQILFAAVTDLVQNKVNNSL